PSCFRQFPVPDRPFSGGRSGCAHFYLHLAIFYPALLNTIGVIVYICVSKIADPQAKLPYTA
ncbi:hypothetical protein, partial [Aeromonas salmonicida]|uniref:hypothetical protein n=1 Tax=Aeromonas salmonicida TaxID=645 RepID=UPI001EE6B775